MALMQYTRRMCTLQQSNLTTDIGGGQAIVSDEEMWKEVAIFPIHVNVESGTTAQDSYGRETITNKVTVQAEDQLPKRVNGERSLKNVLLKSGVQRFRILYQGRTLTILGVVAPVDGSMGPKMVTLDCIETPQPVGYVDETT